MHPTYNRSNLEIMAPYPEHELYKKVMGRFVETLAEEFKIRIYPLGSPTFRLITSYVSYAIALF
ncbi:hypothetical protein [Moorena sp. SIO4G3]|uniref:hypothetical protein n=1 Tax=Moorena sp. SIO4G3 TaxID=2607821 RepID=UPI0025FCEDC9|nr:hypothetical protein [Moorena sp. SIO4G3]